MPEERKICMISRTIKVMSPLSWTDEQVEALLDQVNDIFDGAEAALQSGLEELNQDLELSSES